MLNTFKTAYIIAYLFIIIFLGGTEDFRIWNTWDPNNYLTFPPLKKTWSMWLGIVLGCLISIGREET